MIGFNPDGSIKLPDNIKRQKDQKDHRLKNERCVLFQREIINDRSPKKCLLRLKLSDSFSDNRFVETTYTYFKDSSEVPSKMNKLNEKEFEFEIGTCFSRCRDCNSLITRFREFLDGNVIDEKGGCSYKGGFGSRNFSYGDYFE